MIESMNMKSNSILDSSEPSRMASVFPARRTLVILPLDLESKTVSLQNVCHVLSERAIREWSHYISIGDEVRLGDQLVISSRVGSVVLAVAMDELVVHGLEMRQMPLEVGPAIAGPYSTGMLGPSNPIDRRAAVTRDSRRQHLNRFNRHLDQAFVVKSLSTFDWIVGCEEDVHGGSPFN